MAGLAARRAAGEAPFTVMSCDNLPGNGDVARRMMTAFARLKDPALADWMDEHVAFPNAMVDRITPVTAPEDIERLADEFGVVDGWPVVCEPFTQWVLEDHFTDGRPPFEDAGVQLVDDVVPYELMKLRLLNASHQALCYLGYLSGYRYAHEVCQDPLFVDFLLGYMEHEGSPTLPEVPGVDLDAYRRQLVERFANPEVRDTLARLCAESSDRIPKWLVPVIRAQPRDRRRDRPLGPRRRVVGPLRRGRRRAGRADRHRRPGQGPRHGGGRAPAQGDQLAFLRDRDLFGDLVDDERFTTAYAAALASLHERGARATLETYAARGTDQ